MGLIAQRPPWIALRLGYGARWWCGVEIRRARARSPVAAAPCVHAASSRQVRSDTLTFDR